MAKPIEYEDRYAAETGLKCPRCNEANLHHGTVEVFARYEDAANGLHVIVGPGDLFGVPAGMVVNHDVRKAPGRRHSVRIQFSCEHCHAVDIDDDGNVIEEIPERDLFSLIICQHKGTTYLAWQESDDRSDY